MHAWRHEMLGLEVSGLIRFLAASCKKPCKLLYSLEDPVFVLRDGLALFF